MKKCALIMCVSLIGCIQELVYAHFVSKPTGGNFTTAFSDTCRPSHTCCDNNFKGKFSDRCFEYGQRNNCTSNVAVCSEGFDFEGTYIHCHCCVEDCKGSTSTNEDPTYTVSPSQTPIIFDMLGNGFHLTGSSDGVVFDLDADGVLTKTAWTRSDQDEAFLAFDRNGNGRIEDGSELFGNATPMIDGQRAPNGFVALAEFDLPVKGGNGDSFIDPHDAIFRSLLLWRDSNHDGVSQVNELFPLEELDVARISLDHKESRHQDQYGNIFRYRAKIYMKTEKDSPAHNRFAYDVILVNESIE